MKVAPAAPSGVSDEATVCGTCRGQIENPDTIDINHWRCLNESMWSENLAVQVLAFRQLSQLSKSEGQAQDLLDQMYLEDSIRAWAEAGLPGESGPVTKDSNGTILQDGDSVTLIKDLDVKGGGFTAKRGTMVKNIRLTDNPEHIEGKVEGQQIVLVAKFLKKVN